MMICETCGTEAPTKYVSFYQNIGALVMRFSRQISGNMCKSCVHKFFWQYTTITMFFGWWGIISFIITPFVLLNNFFRYLFCLGMESVPHGALPPELDDAAIDRLTPHIDQLIDRLNSGDDFARVVEDTAMRASVTPGQVALFIRALAAASEAEE